MKKILLWLVFIIFATSSFDIFFNLSLGGFNVRTCYLAAFAFTLIYAIQFSDAAKVRFIGSLSFVIWTVFVMAFFYNTQFIARNVGYIAWLFFNLFVCYAILKISDKVDSERLLRLYVISFLLIALAGILQFLLSSVGIHILVTSWWRFNKFPRVNGFSYEPSYFASYLLIGFVFLYHLTRKELYLFSKRNQILILLTVALAILLSTSRMGILFVVAIFAFDFVVMVGRAVVQLRITRVNLLISAVFIFGFLGTIIKIASDDDLRARYLSGTGVESTASHSRDLRIRQMNDVYNIFMASPFEGYSLGGIAPAIAAYQGDKITVQKKAKEYEGLNIFLEVLAATGVLGFLFFAYWLFKFFKCNYMLSSGLHRFGFENEAIVMDALRKALIAELLILILSQNILRPYLWILIGMLNAFYFRFLPLVYPIKKQPDNGSKIEITSA